MILESVIHRLKERLWCVATAESCTGGLLASQLTECPGSSAWFERGYVTYSNQAKRDMLGVMLETLECFGAVSEPVAIEMASGALQRSRADITVAITGVAGPSGGSTEKPIGTVCFALAMKHQAPYSCTKHFKSNVRKDIRQASCEHALKLLLEFA